MSVAIGSRPGVPADMSHPRIDVAVELDRLGVLTIFELREEWRRLHRQSPPMRMSRDLLTRGILYKLQERSLGGLSRPIIGKLERIQADVDAGASKRETRKSTSPISLKPGTRLIREWRGVTHTVLVHGEGFDWSGQRYRSLTLIAREITGAHWSGPRFFGLRQRSSGSVAASGSEHAQT